MVNMVNNLFKTSRVMLFTAIMMLVLVGVACGSAAKPDTAAPGTSASGSSGAVPTAVAQPADSSDLNSDSADIGEPRESVGQYPG